MSRKINPCCTTEDMVITSMLPPLRIATSLKKEHVMKENRQKEIPIKKTDVKKTVVNYLLITVASAVYSVAVSRTSLD